MVPGMSRLPPLSHCPATPVFMASCKGRNGLQDLMRYFHSRRAVLTRYHRSRTSADGLKKRCNLELQRFFVSTLELLNFDGRPLTCFGLTNEGASLDPYRIRYRSSCVGLDGTATRGGGVGRADAAGGLDPKGLTEFYA